MPESEDVRKRARLLKDIEKSQQNIAKWQKMAAENGKDYTKTIERSEKALSNSIKQLREINAANRRSADFRSSEEKSISSIASEYYSFAQSQRDVLASTKSIGQLSSAQQEFLENYLSNTRDLASLSREDTQQISAKLEYLEQELSIAKRLFGENSEIVQALEAQVKEAEGIASLGEKQKEQLRSQVQAYESIRKTVGGVFDTLRTLTSGIGGFFATTLAGAGFLVDKIGKVNQELGTSFELSAGFANQTAVLSIFFDDAVENAKALSKELGGMDRSSFGLRTNMSLVAISFGISGTEASNLTGIFSRLNGNSTDMAMDMLATSREFAKQNNIIPAQLMSDLANSTEEFALFGRDGGENILRAAGYAAKLGVEMGTLSGIADNLLDFESSITKELELGAMLGRNINLNRARTLAYEGKIGEATLETLRAVGGIEAFNQMDVFAKKQTAATLGVSVAQLQKMASLQAQGVNLSEVTAENFDQTSTAIEGGLNKFGGKFLGVLSGMVASSAQILTNFIQTNRLQKTIQQTQGMGSGVPFTSAATPKPQLGPQPNPNVMGRGSIGSQMSTAGSRATSLLKGAAAMVLVAGSIFILGKALQEFKGIGKDELLAAGAGLLGLTVSVAALGAVMGSGVGAAAILAGAGAMVVVAGSIYILGKALQEMGKGFTMLSSLQEQLLPLMSMTTGIIGLAGSLAVLGASLFTLGTLGSVSIPVLLALGAAGVGLSAVMGKEVETQTESFEMTRSQLSKNITDKLEEVRQEVRKSGQIVLDGALVSRATTRRQDNDVFNIGGTINQ